VKHQQASSSAGHQADGQPGGGQEFSTDIALAVDAIDLVLAERPEVVVIASSDSDFAPLVAACAKRAAWCVASARAARPARRR
jgi:hypothetical protein